MTHYIHIRVPVENTDNEGAEVVARELLAGERPGELALVADQIWISSDGGANFLVK